MTSRNDWKTSVSVAINELSADNLLELKNNGISFIELTGSDTQNFREYAANAKAIFRQASDCGVTVRSLHLPFAPFEEIDPASADSSVRRKFLSVESELLKAAADSGIGIAVVHPSGEPYEEEQRGQHMAYAVDSLAALQKTAAECGIKIAVENLPRTCLGRDCADMAEIFRTVPGLYGCFDSNHSLRDSNVNLIRTMGEKIIAVHISDYDFTDERHWLPGKGKNDWSSIFNALEEVGYSGTWNYEVSYPGDYTAADFAENHHALLTGLIK